MSAHGPAGGAAAAVAALPGVADAVGQAREAVDRLYRHRILRRRGPEVSAESALRGARASAALEGVDVPLDSVRRGEATDPVSQGALRVLAEAARLGRTWRTAPRQVLARLHAVAAVGLADEAELGRPRQGPTGSDVLGIGAVPEAREAMARIEALSDLVTGGEDAPALVLGALVHAELVAVRPFGVVDGLVARAAERLTLMEFGLDPKSLVAVEVGHAESGDAYVENLRGYLKGTPDGVAGWIRHCASAVVLGAREATAVCEALSR